MTLSSSRDSPAQRLRTTMAAMRVSFTWFGVRKALSEEQKARAADAFGAEGDFLSAGKKLIDTRDPAFRAVTSVRHRTTSYFKAKSLSFPEPGIRLVRQDDLEAISNEMNRFQGELTDTVAALDERFDALKSAARERLGRLYSVSDYPEALIGLFDVAWDFPSVEPPSYLRDLSPDLYRQECERVQARFDEAVQLAEAAFLDELARLVEHLTERLSGQDDGRPKVFRDSAVENLSGFFERFRQLNIRSNPQLDELVADAQRVVRGVEPQQLRDNPALRQQVATQLAGVQSVVDGLLVDRPRRAILRRPRSKES
jgi:hypothetical protein